MTRKETAPTAGDGEDEKRERRRIALRNAAYERFSARGYHLTTVDEICVEAGISKGSFYWHYDSKQAVLLAIVDGWAAEVELSLTEHFRGAIARADRRIAVTEGLRALAHRLRKLMPLWLEFLSQAQREPVIREGLSVFHRRVRRATHTMLSALVDNFQNTRESEALATIIVGGFIGLMSLELSDPSDVTFDREVESFMSLLGHSSIEADDADAAQKSSKKTNQSISAPVAKTSDSAREERATKSRKIVR
ncbi:MAG: TetR/AcrR family transcriptional regulator [Deltaproteobacteria bacterium]|nr:TetR/AcrR family transcriptional regulator [Deltaproteobacteria bacterium]